MNKCKCGTEIQDGWKVCPECGEAIAKTEPDVIDEPVDDGQDGGDDKYLKLVNESKKYRKRAQEAEAKLKANADKAEQERRNKMDETERLKLERDELSQKAAKADDYEARMLVMLEKEMEGIPEERRTLVPDGLNTADKLGYITQNRQFLAGQKAPTSKANGSPPRTGTQPAVRLREGLEYDVCSAAVRSLPTMKGKSDEEIHAKVVEKYGVRADAPSVTSLSTDGEGFPMQRAE